MKMRTERMRYTSLALESRSLLSSLFRIGQRYSRVHLPQNIHTFVHAAHDTYLLAYILPCSSQKM